MYEFPPTFRDAWHLYLDAAVIRRLVFTAVLALLSIRIVHRRWSYLAWGVVLAVVMFSNTSTGRAYDFENQIWHSKIAVMQISIALLAVARCVWTADRSPGSEQSGGISLLVTGFIVVSGITVVMPSLRTPRDFDAKIQCKYNLKTIGLALHNYHDIFGGFPMAASPKPERSWRITLLPYLEEGDLHARYHQDEAWNSETNAPLTRERIRAYDCAVRPTGVDDQQRFLSAYAAVTGPDAIFHDHDSVHFRDVTDGTSNTIAVIEACGSQIIWTQPRDVRIDRERVSINGPGSQPGTSSSIGSSFHAGGTQVLRADGSVVFLSEDMDQSILNALTTKSGGETLPETW